MFPILHVGPLAIQVPGLLLLIGLWLGLSLAERFSPHREIQPNVLFNLVFIGLIAGIVGARFAYVFRFPEIFTNNPISVLSLNPGLLDPLAGSLSAIFLALIYIQRKSLPFWSAMDVLTPIIAVLGVAIGLSHLASGSQFGRLTDLPWGIDLWGAKRHPTQFYETLSAGIILAIFWPLRDPWKIALPGKYFLSFMALSASATIFLQAFHADSTVTSNGFRIVQIISWLILALSLITLLRFIKINNQSRG